MIVLIRHAQTTAVKGTCLGRVDMPLSQKGIIQSAQLAEAFGSLPFERLYCSPLKRAIASLSPLVEKGDCKMEIRSELCEINMGTWDGMSFEDIQIQFPEAYEERGQSFAHFRPPEGESFNDVASRILPILELLSREEGLTLLMTHAGVIRSALCLITGLPLNELFSWQQDYAHCTILQHSVRGLEVLTLNQAPDDAAAFIQGKNDSRGVYEKVM